MNSRNEICIGMAGAGRATELHINGLKRYSGYPICLKRIIAKRDEQVQRAKEKYGFFECSTNFEDLINDSEIDVIDICTPPYAHTEMIITALKAGKHVICEKPIMGYFGMQGDEEPIGIKVSKVKMYDEVVKSINELREVINNSDKQFMYAENFIYAPSINKASEIVTKKKCRILYAKGEESLKGSSSKVAGEWSKTGGGTFIRTGAHPLSAILWLKEIEGQTRGETIKVKSVLADMSRITPILSEYEHRYIDARPMDVEDCGTVIITFTDGTKATIIATDTLLGGSRNYVELYCNDAVINCKLTMTDMMSTYFSDEEGLEDVYLSEMLPQKTGWNNLFLEDEIIRGYVDEMRDFMDSVYHNHKPKAGFDLAADTIQIIYAAYKSAELGKVVYL